MSKRNPASAFLWQKAKKKVHYTDENWYEPGCVGHDPLDRYMKHLMKDVKLSNPEYTNHSIRATVITSLSDSGYEARHIIAVTGHRSESTVKQYAKKCPENKKREMSASLANKLDVKKVKIDKQKDIAFGKEPNVASALVTPPTLLAANQIQTPDIPDINMQLLPLDDTDDDLLLKVLDDLDKQNLPSTTKIVSNTVTNVSNVSNVTTRTFPHQSMMPHMYFPNSNVTINYNQKCHKLFLLQVQKTLIYSQKYLKVFIYC